MSYHRLKETKRTARKPHVCIWCGEVIDAGESYWDESSVFDGGMQHHKWHPECRDDADESLLLDETFVPYAAERPKLPDGSCLT